MNGRTRSGPGSAAGGRCESGWRKGKAAASCCGLVVNAVLWGGNDESFPANPTTRTGQRHILTGGCCGGCDAGGGCGTRSGRRTRRVIESWSDACPDHGSGPAWKGRTPWRPRRRPRGSVSAAPLVVRLLGQPRAALPLLLLRVD
jgi:hypothetical protein